jgi:Ni/Co efflux regulator RcnB
MSGAAQAQSRNDGYDYNDRNDRQMRSDRYDRDVRDSRDVGRGDSYRNRDGYRRDGDRYDGRYDGRRDHRYSDRRYYDNRSYSYGNQGYRHGNGHAYGHRNHWRRGARISHDYGRYYVVDDWRRHHGLYAPSRGYHWVQTGNDFALVAITTGIIASILLGN